MDSNLLLRNRNRCTPAARRAAAFRLVTDLLFFNGPSATAFSGEDDSISWDSVVRLAADQLVAPAIGSRIRKKRLEDVLPDAVTDYFGLMLRLNTLRNAQIRNEVVELAMHLNRSGIVPLLIKGGAHLMSGLFEEPGERIISDVDIVIHPERLEDCLASIGEAGYHVFPEDHPHAHSVGSITRPDRSISFDLHKHALPHHFRHMLSIDEIHAGAVEIECEGARIAIPRPTHQAFLNIAHAQLSDKQYVFGHLSFRALYDFHRLQSVHHEKIDWADIHARFEAAKLSWPRDYHVRLASLVGHSDVPLKTSHTVPVNFLVARALWLARHPTVHRLDSRVLRICLHAHRLVRSLADAELRGRFWRKLADPSWRSLHANYIWSGKRTP